MVTIKNLSFHYSKKNWLYKDLNLEIPNGRICGLLGKNGVGKTSLLRLVSGLVFSQQGTCQVLNQKPMDRNPSFLQEIFFLPEEFYLPDIAAKKYLELFAPFYLRFNHESFNQYLKQFELDLSENLEEYSYGQKKKFLIAFAVATNCKLLLLDEPTNGLDIPSKSTFRKLIAGTLDDDKSIIIATHQIRDLDSLIDTIVIIDDGRILFDQTIENISSQLLFTDQTAENSNALYQEKTLGGFQTIQTNSKKTVSAINLELLFNAVLANPEKIKEAFHE